MSKINYAIALLTAASGSAALASTAQAATLFGTFTIDGSTPALNYVETFDIQTTGTPDVESHYTDFVLTNDSMGNTMATIGDETTGYKAASPFPIPDSYFGTGPAGSGPFSNQTFTSVKPELYDSSSPTPVLHPGVYVSDDPDISGVLSLVPEPEAWALLIAGMAMSGGALRTARRRTRVAAA